MNEQAALPLLCLMCFCKWHCHKCWWPRQLFWQPTGTFRLAHAAAGAARYCNPACCSWQHAKSIGTYCSYLPAVLVTHS